MGPRDASLRVVGCVVVRDEGDLLEGCLQSLVPWVSDVIVVDHGSSDQSAAVALRHGATVIDARASGYEDARNAYLDAIDEGWVLVIDADERMVTRGEGQRARLLDWCERHQESRDGFSLPRYEYLGDGDFAEVEVVRLWRAHADVRYPRSAWHASVVPSIEARGGVLQPAPFAQHHVDLLRAGSATVKRARARARGALELAKPNHSPMLWLYMGLEHAALGDLEAACELFAKAVAHEPLCAPNAALFTAQVRLAQGRLDEAAHQAQRALHGRRVHRGNAPAHVLLAEVAYLCGDLERAHAALLAARLTRRWYASAHLNLAAHWIETDRPRASVHLSRALRCNGRIFDPEIEVPGDRPSIYLHQRTLTQRTRGLRTQLRELAHQLHP
ncbi:MAG: glycosyltransferase [Deltaproteobacteria bacterium]|nr:glycosyltransferase [Deltaproteobacteria bacterium]